MAQDDKPRVVSDVAQRFSEIAYDLFNVEVNIILRDNITAQKMPSPRHALIDIGKEFCAALTRMELQYRLYQVAQNLEVSMPAGDLFDEMRRKFGFFTAAEMAAAGKATEGFEQLVDPQISGQMGSFDAFDILRNWANYFLKDPLNNQYLEKAQLSVLPRIKDNSDLLKGMFGTLCHRDEVVRAAGLAAEMDKLPSAQLSPGTIVYLSKQLAPERTRMLINQYTRSDIVNDDDIPPLPIRDQDLVFIRKIWELGTEVIAMQTIVQVDGDVITRLNPNYINEKKYARLKEYHNESVDIALKHWAALVNVAKELISAISQGISGSRPS